MARSRCRFCGHDNPGGARFCNDCGSPLYLKPCPQCEAVNDDWADCCYQCGTVLRPTATEAETVGAVQALTTETETVGAMADFATATAAHRGRPEPVGPGHVPESFAQRYDLDAWRGSTSGEAQTHAGVHDDEMAERPRAETLEPREAIPAAADPTDRVAPPRVASRGVPVLIAILLLAAGGGYYTYRYGISPAGLTGAGAPVVSRKDNETTPQPGAFPGSTAAEDPSPPSVPVTTPADRPVSDSADRPAPRSTAARRDNATVPAVPARIPDARSMSKGSGAANVDEARSAVETNRMIARELGNVPSPRASSASTLESRAAAETSRIIARELGNPATQNSTGRDNTPNQ